MIGLDFLAGAVTAAALAGFAWQLACLPATLRDYRPQHLRSIDYKGRHR